MIWDEKYKECQEHGDKLKRELSSARQQLTASRAAAASAQPSDTLLQQKVRYDMEILNLRREIERLQDIGEKAIKQNREELEQLTSRVETIGPSQLSKSILDLLEHFFKTVETNQNQFIDVVNETSERFKNMSNISTQDPDTLQRARLEAQRCEEEKAICQRSLEKAKKDLETSTERAESLLKQLEKSEKLLEDKNRLLDDQEQRINVSTVERNQALKELDECKRKLKQDLSKAKTAAAGVEEKLDKSGSIANYRSSNKNVKKGTRTENATYRKLRTAGKDEFDY